MVENLYALMFPYFSREAVSSACVHPGKARKIAGRPRLFPVVKRRRVPVSVDLGDG